MNTKYLLSAQFVGHGDEELLTIDTLYFRNVISVTGRAENFEMGVGTFRSYMDAGGDINTPVWSPGNIFSGSPGDQKAIGGILLPSKMLYMRLRLDEEANCGLGVASAVRWTQDYIGLKTIENDLARFSVVVLYCGVLFDIEHDDEH